jgi:hypothetical protein
MNTNRLSLIMGSITVAIHLAGFAVVDIGAKHFLARTASYHDLGKSRSVGHSLYSSTPGLLLKHS